MGGKKSNHRYRRLLRFYGKRPCCCATDKRDEIPSSHGGTPRVSDPVIAILPHHSVEGVLCITAKSRARRQMWVIRDRSLGAENRFMSAMPRKRQRAVKASPVAMGPGCVRIA